MQVLFIFLCLLNSRVILIKAPFYFPVQCTVNVLLSVRLLVVYSKVVQVFQIKTMEILLTQIQIGRLSSVNHLPLLKIPSRHLIYYFSCLFNLHIKLNIWKHFSIIVKETIQQIGLIWKLLLLISLIVPRRLFIPALQ